MPTPNERLRACLAPLVAVSTLVILAACATVPFTGRSQFRLLSDDALIPTANQEFDRHMAMFARRNAVLSAAESPAAGRLVERVNRVADRIIDASGMRHKRSWETILVKAKEANAYVMPNGKIVIFTGLLPITGTEAGLAAIIGHEVGHLVGQHQAERVSQVLMGNFILQGVDLGLALANSPYRPVIVAAASIGAQYGIVLPFSRAHELEADHLGMIFMAKAGYDPAEAVRVWERMEAQSGAGPWELLSTHPSDATRRAQLLARLPEATGYYTNHDRPLPPPPTRVAAAPQAPVAPVAPRPSFLPGYWWRTKQTGRAAPSTFRYERDQPCEERPGVKATCYVVESEAETKLFTEDYAMLEGVTKETKKHVKFRPGFKYVDWPLELGKSWTQAMEVEVDGKRGVLRARGEVVAYESVTVPAGTFMAYKIELSLRDTKAYQYWYAPEVRNVVRFEVFAVFGMSFKGEEMLDYQKTNEPVIQPEQER